MTKFNISVIVVAKMITYKFLGDFLLKMRCRSAVGVFARQSYRLVSQKRLVYKFYMEKSRINVTMSLTAFL